MPILSTAQKVITGISAKQIVKESKKIILNPDSKIPLYVEFSDSINLTTENWAAWFKKNFSCSDGIGFKQTTVEQDGLGERHIRFQQTINEIPVEGAVVIVHEKDKIIKSFNGKTIQKISLTKSSITEEVALSYALNYIGGTKYKWEIPAEEKMLKHILNNPDATYYPKAQLTYVPISGKFDKEPYTLAYKFDIYSAKPLKRSYVFVDASTGKILFENNRIHITDAPGTAHTKYSGSQNFTTDFTGSTYRLRESGRGNGIETYDLNTGTDVLTAVDFTDGNNDWNNFNPQWDEAATDAHWAAEKTYDFYFNKYNRNSIDGSGFKLISYVHYDVSFVNAFWDGTCMTYGDGDGTTYFPLTTVDICGHEITHGLTENTAGLIYSSESGALNEAYSDVFGTSIEFYAKPLDANWTIGENMGPPFRDMHNPNSYSNPDTYLGLYWDFAEEVHCNSGVFNYWFYLLTAGGSGTNDNGNIYNVSAIGMDKADSIAYRALLVYMTPSTTYFEARNYTLLAAADLYGSCSAEVQAVGDAWYAVGVGGPYSNTVVSDFYATDTVFCNAPVDVPFTNLSSNSNSFIWDFGDGSPTSTLTNPTHHYAATGLFNVTLTAIGGGGCGPDDVTVKSSYINISTLNPCIANMPNSGTGVTQTSCFGALFDSGGNQNYPDNTSSVITLSPSGATNVTLNFVSFAFEQNWDYLYVYDGPTIASPLIGQYDGYSLPNGGTIMSSGPSITLRQFTDQYVNYSGFELNWSCTVGLNETNNEASAVDIFPNPTSGVVNIRTNFSDAIVTFMNPLGQEVLRDNFSYSTGNVMKTFDLSGFAKGIYFVKIVRSNETIIRKITLN